MARRRCPRCAGSVFADAEGGRLRVWCMACAWGNDLPTAREVAELQARRLMHAGRRPGRPRKGSEPGEPEPIDLVALERRVLELGLAGRGPEEILAELAR